MAQPLKAVQNNTSPQYQWVADRDDGTIIVLTGKTVTMKLYRGSTQMNTTVNHDACVVVDAASGIFGWTPQAGDLSLPGDYFGDVKVANVDGTFEVLYGQALLEVGPLGVQR